MSEITVTLTAVGTVTPPEAQNDEE